MSNLDHKIKTAAGKVPLDLIPLRALFGPSRACQHGTIKYEIGNYLRATDDAATANRYGGAALRHLADMQGLDGVFARPDALDDESGLPHLDHLIATLLMLRSILIQSGRLPADPGPSRFVRDAAMPLANRLADREMDLTGLAAREAAPSLTEPEIAAVNALLAHNPGAINGRITITRPNTGTITVVSHPRSPVDVSPLDDAYWQRHPIGSPARVQAVEEHRAAVMSAAAMAANHAEES